MYFISQCDSLKCSTVCQFESHVQPEMWKHLTVWLSNSLNCLIVCSFEAIYFSARYWGQFYSHLVDSKSSHRTGNTDKINIWNIANASMNSSLGLFLFIWFYIGKSIYIKKDNVVECKIKSNHSNLCSWYFIQHIKLN